MENPFDAPLDAPEEVQNAAFAARLPPFWNHSPEAWFTSVESQFHIAQIRRDEVKYNYVLSALPQEIVNTILDIARHPPEHNKYPTLKAALITRHTVSEERRLEELLSNAEPGDRRPSDFYRHMLALAGDPGILNDKLLYKLWIIKMRRGSLTPLMSQSSMEPVIVVDEPTGTIPEEIDRHDGLSPQQSVDLESPTLNPYLLSPWRDPREVRKHSLPTPQCAGITASQVRRLSDRGGEGPSPREAAFLATLSQAPGPSPGGRRHSVVTISKVPTTIFGRSRRESIAAYPTGGAPSRILGSRRESVGTVGPPSTEHRGSIHNLQLDIMDDIVTARKVRMKMWNTSNEKVCEVQPLDEAGVSAGVSTQRYTQAANMRRFSDFVGTQLTAIPSVKRRASEFPVPATIISGSKDDLAIGKDPSRLGASAAGTSGIVCSNTDLICILSSNLTSSATEINQIPDEPSNKSPMTLEQKRNRLKSKRSNSFDVSILHGTNIIDQQSNTQNKQANWFVKRHQPMSTKKENKPETRTTVTFMTDKQPTVEKPKDRKTSTKNGKESNKVVWDGRSGSLVDAEALGSAIEVFLRRGGTPESSSGSICSSTSPSKGAIPKTTQHATKTTNVKTKTAGSTSGWYSNKDNEEENTESCDTSLCSTLKDLFVK